MITDTLDRAALYPLGPAWQHAVAFLAQLTPATPDGEVPLIGDRMLARIMSYETKTPEQAVLEAHRRYVDIQIVLSGSEIIEWFPRRTLTVSTPYTDKAEAEFYTRPAPGPVRITLTPGMFVVLHPDDAHMPALQTNGRPEPVRKVVIKVAVDLLDGIRAI